jgi:flagellar hook-associated protein 3 FlgL
MGVSRVATANYYQSVLTDLMRAQNRQLEAQKEVSTGKRGDDLLGFSDRARSLVAAQSVKARVDGLVDQLGALDVKLSAQQLALESVSDASQGLREAIGGALASGRADGLMNQVQNYFSQTIEGLNARYGDGYLFSGGLVDTKPVNVTTLAQLAAAPSAAAVFDNGTLVPVSRMDDSSSLETGFLADAAGQELMDQFRQLQTQHGLTPFSGQMTDAQRTFLEGLYANMEGVTERATGVTAQGGSVQKRVENAAIAQTARQTTLENMLADITEVDVAEAYSKLSQAQMAVQASASVFLSLKDMSLLNYLK